MPEEGVKNRNWPVLPAYCFSFDNVKIYAVVVNPEVKIYLCLYGYMEFTQRVLVALPQHSTPHTPRVSTFFAQLFLIIQKC
ncbi:hypothetical protein T01_6545 [Trichinella spiralis]|uniref:Uncharacterized protein n=1 Tax=Trichinella spiralis TaxID=6334 RepID=A0A0V1AUG2_TRISP|nr:hypothetical protein T01_12972 [Trichinella spiralis]KRY28233.1 hypothetical protein T01_6545 [Trichinella spiralis]